MDLQAHTVRVTCSCDTCETNAAKVGAPFPLAALIRPVTAAGLGLTTPAKAAKAHGLVYAAHDPSLSTLTTARRIAIPA